MGVMDKKINKTARPVYMVSPAYAQAYIEGVERGEGTLFGGFTYKRQSKSGQFEDDTGTYNCDIVKAQLIPSEHYRGVLEMHIVGDNAGVSVDGAVFAVDSIDYTPYDYGDYVDAVREHGAPMPPRLPFYNWHWCKDGSYVDQFAPEDPKDKPSKDLPLSEAITYLEWIQKLGVLDTHYTQPLPGAIEAIPLTTLIKVPITGASIAQDVEDENLYHVKLRSEAPGPDDVVGMVKMKEMFTQEDPFRGCLCTVTVTTPEELTLLKAALW